MEENDFSNLFDKLTSSFKQLEKVSKFDLFEEDIPNFIFALREDLVDSEIDFTPVKGTDKSSGWDVKAAFSSKDKVIVRAGEYIKIPLGMRVLSPDGWWLELRPRSSSFAKKSLHALYGVIDCDYEGELIFVAQYLPDIRSLSTDLEINFGDNIGQLLPKRVEQANFTKTSNEDLNKLYKERGAARGAGGFGSTSK